jgi:hypothetical protein
VPNFFILLVIAVGIGLVAFGVARQDDGGGGGGPSFGAQQPIRPAPPLPRHVQAPAVPAHKPQPAQGQPDAHEPSPARLRRAKRRLDRTTVLGRFSVGVPQGWSRGMGGGAVVLQPGDDAEIRVFLQPGAEPLNRLERQANGFLKREHSAAKVAPGVPLRLGSGKGREIRAVYRGGTETAIVVAADGYSYLLLGRVDAGASPSREAAALASLRSFRSE